MGISKFKMPAKSNLKGRSSTISNAFAIAITPYIIPKEDELRDFYSLLEIEENQCAYCLGEGNGKDHLKPLVRNGLPTGYITDLHNLVPCCQACNSSKGAKEFKDWYISKPNKDRLISRGMTEEQIMRRYKVVSNYEELIPDPLDYKSIVGDELWNEYEKRRKDMIQQLNDNQEFCDKLYNKIIMKISEN